MSGMAIKKCPANEGKVAVMVIQSSPSKRDKIAAQCQRNDYRRLLTGKTIATLKAPGSNDFNLVVVGR